MIEQNPDLYDKGNVKLAKQYLSRFLRWTTLEELEGLEEGWEALEGMLEET